MYDSVSVYMSACIYLTTVHMREGDIDYFVVKVILLLTLPQRGAIQKWSKFSHQVRTMVGKYRHPYILVYISRLYIIIIYPYMQVHFLGVNGSKGRCNKKSSHGIDLVLLLNNCNYCDMILHSEIPHGLLSIFIKNNEFLDKLVNMELF